MFPRLWHVCHKHGYITAGDFVRGRFGNRWLALAITITGIVATMPYIALQLVGIQVVIGALGISGHAGWAADLPLIIAFVVLAAFTYSSGLRAPASIAIVKDILIYITAFAAIIVIPMELGGFGKIFAAVPAQKLLLAVPGPNTTGAYGAYATLALGSALALFLYPHSLTGILSASSGHAIRRNAALLPGYSFMLGSAGAVRLLRDRRRRRQASRIRRRLQAVRQQLCGAGAVPAQLPVLVRRHRLCRDRHRRAGAGGDHVDRRGQSLHPQHPSRVHQQESDRQAGSADGEVGVADRQGRRAGVHPVRADAIRHSAAAAGRHLDHPDAAGGDARRLHALVQRLGTAARLGRRDTIAGTAMAVAANLTPTYPLQLAGHVFPGYTAFYTLILNLAVAAVLTPVFNTLSAGQRAPVDETVAADYHA